MNNIKGKDSSYKTSSILVAGTRNPANGNYYPPTNKGAKTMLSAIRLFKALPVEHKNIPNVDASRYEALMKETLPKGFILDPVLAGPMFDQYSLIEEINKAYGRSSEELNATFHKSFAKVRDSSTLQLVFEQIIHYMTTYGAERMGIYNEQSVYIPAEQLDAPELKDGVRLVVIRALTKEEMKAELIELLSAGVALSEQTIKDAIDIAQFVSITVADIEQIKNKEVKAALFDYLGLVPSHPVEFLRYVVYRATEKTLLIKNKALIEQLKARNNNDLVRYFDAYEKEFGLQNLAKIFYRYKPIFLAVRTNTQLKKQINKIRRLANVNHEPMKEDLLNTLTARLKTRHAPDAQSFNAAMANTSVFRKIRLAYALKFRTTEADSILYRVRNGKSFAKEFNFDNKRGAQIMFEAILRHITADIKPNVDGKSFFIPKGLKYALPATEKQFTGNLPNGTYIEVPEDMVVGIHWENQKNYRVDLDLSISNNMGKIGWDASFRDGKQDIQFSGDITDAPKPKGATEVFHVGGVARGSWLMNLNYYNFDAQTPVPFKILVAQETRDMVEKNYTVDPNKIMALTNSVIDVKQKTLGIIVATDDSTRFYFSETGFQNNISSRHTNAAEQSRKFLMNYFTDSIVLNDVLEAAGATIVDEPGEGVIDLSPEAIDKTTIIDLLKEAK